MKKDIEQRKVEGVAIAIVPETLEDLLWDCYLINEHDEPLKHVMITTRGYGKLDDEDVRTTTLRYFYDEVGPNRAISIEPIQASLFNLVNEFWVSFRLADHTYDKKYIFVAGSIAEEHFTHIDMLQRRGVLHP